MDYTLIFIGCMALVFASMTVTFFKTGMLRFILAMAGMVISGWMMTVEAYPVATWVAIGMLIVVGSFVLVKNAVNSFLVQQEVNRFVDDSPLEKAEELNDLTHESFKILRLMSGKILNRLDIKNLQEQRQKIIDFRTNDLAGYPRLQRDFDSLIAGFDHLLRQ